MNQEHAHLGITNNTLQCIPNIITLSLILFEIFISLEIDLAKLF